MTVQDLITLLETLPKDLQVALLNEKRDYGWCLVAKHLDPKDIVVMYKDPTGWIFDENELPVIDSTEGSEKVIVICNDFTLPKSKGILA